jgi:hypothetical protein
MTSKTIVAMIHVAKATTRVYFEHKVATKSVAAHSLVRTLVWYSTNNMYVVWRTLTALLHTRLDEMFQVLNWEQAVVDAVLDLML